MAKTHICIGFAEALPAPEVVFSLRNAGYRVSAFARTARPTLIHLGVPIVVIPAPEADTTAAIAAIQTLMQGDDAPDYILPLDDTGLWLVDRALGDDPRNAGASQTQAAVALDKAQQTLTAQNAGLDVPPTQIVRQVRDLDGITHFPAIARPALAVRINDDRLGKDDPVYLNSETDLAKIDPNTGPYLIQPLIAGIGEGVFGLMTPQGVKAWSGHRRVRMMNPHGSGASACQSITPDPALCAKIETFLHAIDWHGPFMIELLHDAQGTAWFMELNGRQWGSLALARRQGFEYPAWAIAHALDTGFTPPVITTKPLVQRHLGRELLHLLFVLRGPKSSFHKATWPSFWRSLMGVFTPAPLRSFYNYDPKHRGFLIRDTWVTLKKVLR
jgi:hypothetical protein